MVKRSPMVEINGRKYNADSGKLVTKADVAANKQTAKTPRTIDGFGAPLGASPRNPATAKHSKAVHTTTQKTKKLHKAIAKPSKPQRIKSVTSQQTKPHPRANAPSRTRQELTKSVKPDRINRAAKQKRSSLIAKFSKTKGEVSSLNPPQPADTMIPAQAPLLRQQPKTAPVAKEQTAEKQPNWFSRKISAKPKLVPTLSIIAVLLLATGYFTYLNIPNLALRVAASRAGFDASLPGYKPSGFSFDGPIAYSPGQITVKYTSNSDERQFNIIQKKSSWDSQSLLDNYVVRNSPQYLTFQERGLIVYVYGGSNATWVDGGVWYTVEGESLLTSEQLLKIAGSL